jgi:hypothetical protein
LRAFFLFCLTQFFVACGDFSSLLLDPEDGKVLKSLGCHDKEEQKMALFPLASGWRRPLWMGSLVFLGAVFSLGFSCAMPLASFAAVGALTLRRHDALVLIGAVWLANQTTGFTLLGRLLLGAGLLVPWRFLPLSPRTGSRAAFCRRIA